MNNHSKKLFTAHQGLTGKADPVLSVIKGGRKGYSSFLFLLLPFFLTACMVGPDYSRPPVEVPQQWRFEEQEISETAGTAWWEAFKDPVLTELIAVALRENKDVLIASARIEEFMGRYQVTRSALFPQVGAEADAGRERITEEGRTPAAGIKNPDNVYQGFLSGGWEIDLWGKLRRANEAARAAILSTEEARRGVILSLVAAVAGTYVDLRDFDRELEIARRTAVTREETFKIFNLRFDAGVISELELRQVESEYEAALAVIPQIEKAGYFQENLLSVLIGRNPEPILRGKAIDELIPPEVPAGLPSDLLTRRPDIRGAEQDLIAANALIGVARAAYFPSIVLTGDYGTAGSDLNDLFSGPAGVWSYAASVTAPIFTAGRISGNVKAAEAVQQQALVRYEQVIQNSFREVEDSLIDRVKTGEQLQAQQRQVEALRSYARLARLRYDEGYTSYIEVLDAERTLFSVELDYTRTQAAFLRSYITMYRAMGGGWITEAERMAPESGVLLASPIPGSPEDE